MITDKEAIFLAERCFGYREAADLLKSQKSIVFKCNAAFQLAMCGEFALKFILHTNSVDVSSTHNHKILIRCCGENKIQIPKIVRMCAEYMYEFEASTRYDSDFVLDSDIYSRVEDAATVLLDIINKYYIKPVSDGIRCKLPHSLQSLSDFEIFTQYYNI